MTQHGGAADHQALAQVFAAVPPVNSIKSAVGHTLGAAGALEAVVCVRALETDTIPPTAGLASPDPACAALDLVHGGPRTARVDVVLSTSSGFAGANAALVLTAA